MFSKWASNTNKTSIISISETYKYHSRIHKSIRLSVAGIIFKGNNLWFRIYNVQQKESSVYPKNNAQTDTNTHIHTDRDIWCTTKSKIIPSQRLAVPGEFPAQRPVTRSFDVFFDLRLNKRLSEQSWGWWFETLPRPLWRHSNDLVVIASNGMAHTICRVPFSRMTTWHGKLFVLMALYVMGIHQSPLDSHHKVRVMKSLYIYIYTFLTRPALNIAVNLSDI